jgi:hypothetical protein
VAESILYPVPYRHFVFASPRCSAAYFRYGRDLLKGLCHVAHECLIARPADLDLSRSACSEVPGHFNSTKPKRWWRCSPSVSRYG